MHHRVIANGVPRSRNAPRRVRVLSHVFADQEKPRPVVVLFQTIQQRGCIARTRAIVISQRNSMAMRIAVRPGNQRPAEEL